MKRSDLFKYIVAQIIILGIVIPLTASVTRDSVLREYGIAEDKSGLSNEKVMAAEDEKESDNEKTAGKIYEQVKEPEIKRELPLIFEDPKLQKALEELAERDERVYTIAERYTKDFEDDKEENLGLLEFMISEPESVDFVYGLFDATGKETGRVSYDELKEGYPSFVQWDTRWGYVPYGDGIIAKTGCAPTAMSIVAMGLTGDTSLTPAKVAKYAEEHGFYINGVGTDWLFFIRAAKAFGVNGEILRFDEKRMKKALDQGHPIILSVGPGDFTRNGHIVVVSGYNDDGFVIIDPASKIRSGKTWDFESLIPQVKQLWVFSKL